MSALGTRDVALERISARPEPFDVLVVGGGVTGAGVALDAASRGLSVALVEAADISSGTSSKSSKLVHGGLRYLEQREFALTREASVERDLLRRLAPHLVEPIPFVLPEYGRRWRAKYGVGLWAYDAIAAFKNLKIHKHIEPDEATDLVPAFAKANVRGGFMYYDCRTDDARLVVEILVQAQRFGAVIANYARVEAIDPGADVVAAEVHDVLSGARVPVQARRLIVAAGVWADGVEALARPEAEARVRPSKGIHLVFRRSELPMGQSAALIPDADNTRLLFVIPWHDAVVVGTTDTPYDGDISDPKVEERDRDYCLDALNSTFALDLGPEHVAGAYAGLRPLVAGRSGATADMSRKHLVYDIADGVVGVTGGKLTTWRRMAKDVVDRIAQDVESKTRCRTGWIRLGCSDLGVLRGAVSRRARKLGISDETAAHLVRTYGDRCLAILDLASATGLTEPLVPGHPPLAAEAVYAARWEMAQTLSDLLARRTRLALTDPAAGIGTGSAAIDLMARELKWDRRKRKSEVLQHRRVIERERNMALGAPLHPTPGTEKSQADAG